MEASSPKPILTQMPWNVKQSIIDCSVLQVKGTIRELSKDFKALVDNSQINYRSLSVELIKNSGSEDCVRITLATEDHTLSVEFHNDPEGYRVVKANREEKSVMRGGEFPFIQRAAEHLAKVLKNPKLRFGELMIRFHSPCSRNYHPLTVRQFNMRKRFFLRRLSGVLSQLNHQLQVEKFQFHFDGSHHDVLAVLPNLKPRILKSISLFDMNWPQDGYAFLQEPIEIDMFQIISMNQWKQATSLSAGRFLLLEQRINVCSHFDELTCHVTRFTLQDLKHLLQIYMNKPSFQSSEIFCSNFEITEINNYLSQYTELFEAGVTDGRKIQIPNSDDYLQVKFPENPKRISIFKVEDLIVVD